VLAGAAIRALQARTYRRLLQAPEQVVVLQLEDVVIGLDLFAGLLGGQPGLASFLLAHEGGATCRLGDSDSRHASFLLGPERRQIRRD
jgi:hypothetical protein